MFSRKIKEKRTSIEIKREQKRIKGPEIRPRPFGVISHGFGEMQQKKTILYTERFKRFIGTALPI